MEFLVMRSSFKSFLGSVLCAALLITNPAVASWNQTDINNANNANPAKLNAKDHGNKYGAGKCVFDPSANSDDRSIAAHTCGLKIPKEAIVKFAAYKVLTTFTSATDAATIAVSIVSANDVVSAVAISNGGNPWDAAVAQETVPKIETSSTWLTTTAESDVTFTVAVEALTAGKLVIWVEWLYYDDV